MNYQSDSLVEVPETAAGPDDGSMIALLETARSVQEKLEKVLDSVGLSPAKYQALDALVRAEQPLALSELAGCLNCVRSNITQLMDRLEAEGLVKRVDDPNDRRGVLATVTPLGLERQAAGAKQLALVQKEFAKALAGTDRDTLARVLAAMR